MIHHQTGYARAAYDRFRIAQSSLVVEGLWERNLTFFIVCRGFKDLSDDVIAAINATISDVANATLDIRLVPEVPEGATEVRPRTTDEIIEGTGDVGTMEVLFHDLALALPPEFPDVRLTNGENGVFVLTCVRPLSDEEHQAAVRAFERVRPDARFRVSVGELPAPLTSMSHTLISSKALPAGCPKEARWAIERDEQFWLDRRHDVFTSDTLSRRDLLPNTFAKGTSCLVDAVAPRNARTYLPIFGRVVLIAARAKHQDRWLAELAITKTELLELAALGRVQVVFHGDYPTYDLSLLGALAERAPHSIVLSRSLAAATVVDHRRRTGIASTLDIAERAAFLATLRQHARGIVDPLQRKLVDAVLADRERASLAEVEWNRCGANAALRFGPGKLAADVVAAIQGRDLFVELTGAGSLVAFGGALGSIVFPAVADDYSAQAATELCASLYSGTRAGPITTKLGEVETVVEDLLGFDNDAPVIELAKAFTGDEIERLRAIALGIANANLDPDFRRAASTELLDRVHRYESRVEHQMRFDVLSAVGALGSLSTVAATIAGAPAVGVGLGLVPFAAWVLKAVLSSGTGGKYLDRVLALNAFTRADAVLVSRVRRKVSSK